MTKYPILDILDEVIKKGRLGQGDRNTLQRFLGSIAAPLLKKSVMIFDRDAKSFYFFFNLDPNIREIYERASLLSTKKKSKSVEEHLQSFGRLICKHFKKENKWVGTPILYCFSPNDKKSIAVGRIVDKSGYADMVQDMISLSADRKEIEYKEEFFLTFPSLANLFYSNPYPSSEALIRAIQRDRRLEHDMIDYLIQEKVTRAIQRDRRVQHDMKDYLIQARVIDKDFNPLTDFNTIKKALNWELGSRKCKRINCKRPIEGRTDKSYCSDACRQAVYRARGKRKGENHGNSMGMSDMSHKEP
jgi:hypothetical protein